MQAIYTKFLPATNSQPSRIKATCERGSITIPYPNQTGEKAHREAVEALLAKFYEEDLVTWGDRRTPWWPGGYVMGETTRGNYVAVPLFSFNTYRQGEPTSNQ